MAFNLFEAPEYYQGLLGEDATKKLQNKALTTSLINAAIGYIAQPKNQGYGSALPYLGRALAGGYQAGQETIKSGLTDYETQQKIAEMKRKQEQQQALQGMIGGIQDPNEKLYAQLAPEQYVAAKLKPKERKVEKIGNQIVDITGDTPNVLFTGEKELKAPPIRERQVGRTKIQEELQADGTWKEIGKGAMDAPQQAKEVSYTVQTDANGNAVYVPNKPGFATLDMAGKPTTYKPAPTAAEAKVQEKAAQAKKLPVLIGEAEKIIKDATGSYIGAGLDVLGKTVGVSTSGAQNIARLKGIEANLVLSMPRLEGPQSNLDQQLYREAAGQIGDPTVPPDTKLAALETIKRINTTYDSGNAPAQPAAQAQPIPKIGAEKGGYVFKGGNPNDPKSWIKKGK